MKNDGNLLACFAVSKYFSKLGAKNGYWSVKLEKNSSFLTTFNTPFGYYRYCRMPYGLVMSQDVFQQKWIRSLKTVLELLALQIM